MEHTRTHCWFTSAKFMPAGQWSPTYTVRFQMYFSCASNANAGAPVPIGTDLHHQTQLQSQVLQYESRRYHGTEDSLKHLTRRDMYRHVQIVMSKKLSGSQIDLPELIYGTLHLVNIQEWCRLHVWSFIDACRPPPFCGHSFTLAGHRLCVWSSIHACRPPTPGRSLQRLSLLRASSVLVVTSLKWVHMARCSIECRRTLDQQTKTYLFGGRQ